MKIFHVTEAMLAGAGGGRRPPHDDGPGFRLGAHRPPHFDILAGIACVSAQVAESHEVVVALRAENGALKQEVEALRADIEALKTIAGRRPGGPVAA